VGALTENELDKILSEYEAGVVVLADKDDGIACGFAGGVHEVMALLGMTLVEIQKESGEKFNTLGKMLNKVIAEAIEKENEKL
jgi:hypothetical protein